jgi:hypothetical protein
MLTDLYGTLAILNPLWDSSQKDNLSSFDPISRWLWLLTSLSAHSMRTERNVGKASFIDVSQYIPESSHQGGDNHSYILTSVTFLFSLPFLFPQK